MLADLPDNELVKIWCDGDETAFTVLHDRYRFAVVTIVYRILHDLELAEDATQEIFMQIHKNRHNFERTKSLFAWIRTISRNKALDWRRYRIIGGSGKIVPFSTFPYYADDTGILSFPDKRPSADETLERKDLAQAIERATATLSHDEAEAFTLFVQEGWSHKEIADTKGIPIGTSRSHLSHAKHKMRLALTSER